MGSGFSIILSTNSRRRAIPKTLIHVFSINILLRFHQKLLGSNQRKILVIFFLEKKVKTQYEEWFFNNSVNRLTEKSDFENSYIRIFD